MGIHTEIPQYTVMLRSVGREAGLASWANAVVLSLRQD